MGVLQFFSYTKTEIISIEGSLPVEVTSSTAATASIDNDRSKSGANKKGITNNSSLDVPKHSNPIPAGMAVKATPVTADVIIEKPRRFSLRPFAFYSKKTSNTKPVLSTVHDQEKRTKASEDLAKRAQKVQISKSDKRAKQSALALRTLIVGPSSVAAPKITSTAAKPQLSQLKTQLMQPKSANKLIIQLRTLPAHEEIVNEYGDHPKGPIHAVCLEHTDDEEHQLHFAMLCHQDRPRGLSTNVAFQGVVSAPLEQLTEMFNNMNVVDLIGSPDFGLGQPGNGKGILAGAVPTAETVLQGFRQVTPELMALGYATGKVITPDHSGLHPPTDRISILTYWWGFELLLPPPTLLHLTKAQSVSGSLMNFLSALALVNNGVREILPFIRYIAQFVDFEFKAIKAQDKGYGVVCAATWIIPAALVPRPWDFPISSDLSASSEDPQATPGPSNQAASTTDPTVLPPTPSSILDMVTKTHMTPAPAQPRKSLLKATA